VLSSLKPTLYLPSSLTPPRNGAGFESFGRQDKSFFILAIITFKIIPRYRDRKLQTLKVQLLSSLM
jgi:hypothetical protein